MSNIDKRILAIAKQVTKKRPKTVIDHIERYLQIDHRIPYEVAGEEIGDERNPEKFMLLSGSAQRQKSWSCEHCQNYWNFGRLKFAEPVTGPPQKVILTLL